MTDFRTFGFGLLPEADRIRLAYEGLLCRRLDADEAAEAPEIRGTEFAVTLFVVVPAGVVMVERTGRVPA